MRLQKTCLALASVAVTSVAVPASAALIASEPFAYTAGVDLHGQNGGSGWSSPWIEASYNLGNPDDLVKETIGAGSLSFTTLQTSGNRVVSGGKYSYDFRDLNSSLGSNGSTLYASFLLRRDTAGPDPTNNGPDYGGLILGDENFPNSLFFGSGGGTYVLQNGDGTGVQTSGVPELLGNTALLVARIDFVAGAETIRLYVNPIPGGPEPIIANATKTDLTLPGFTQISISTGALATWSLDELRFGTTFSDVTPAVPEPSSAMLMTLGGFALLRRRRRA